MCKCEQSDTSQLCKAAESLAEEYNSRPSYTETDDAIIKDVMEFMSCLSKNVKSGHMEWTSGKKIYDTLKSVGRNYDRHHFDRVISSLARDNKIKEGLINFHYWAYMPA